VEQSRVHSHLSRESLRLLLIVVCALRKGSQYFEAADHRILHTEFDSVSRSLQHVEELVSVVSLA
jgi:hypothetical protein